MKNLIKQYSNREFKRSIRITHLVYLVKIHQIKQFYKVSFYNDVRKTSLL